MSDGQLKLFGYEVQSAIIVRLSALSALAIALENAKENETRIRAALLAAAPRSLQRYLDEEEVIDYLFKHGRYSTHLYFDHQNLRDFDTLKGEVEELQKAWAEQVTVHLGTEPESDRVSIRFGVAQL